MGYRVVNCTGQFCETQPLRIAPALLPRGSRKKLNEPPLQ